MRRGFPRLGRRAAGALVVAVAVAVASVLSACGSGDGSGGGGTLEKAQEAGSITAGVANEKPFGFVEGGELKGFAPDVARAVMKRLGVDELRGVVTQFDSLIPGLQAKRYDMIAAGMSVTRDRCKAALFSNPFFTLPAQFAVKRGNPLGLESLDDVASKDARLGVLAGSVGLTAAKQAHIEHIQAYADVTAGIDALLADRIDAFADGTVTITPAVADKPSLGTSRPLFLVLNGERVVVSGAFTFHLGDDELVDKFNAELKRMQDSGEIVEIAKPYGLGPDEINSAAEFTAAELCRTVDL